MLIPSVRFDEAGGEASLSRRVNANSQLTEVGKDGVSKLIKKGEC